MKVRFLLDENLPPRLIRALRGMAPGADVLRVGDPQALPLGTKDPELLVFLDSSGRLLVTLNRSSMNAHLESHLAAGGHTWGVVWIKRRSRIMRVVEDLALIWEASEAEEWRDRTDEIPF